MRILIAHDGSRSSIEAIQGLRSAGLPNELDALILSVEDRSKKHQSAEQGSQGSRVLNAQDRVQDGAALIAAESPHWRIQTATDEGSPVASILKHAGDWQADLIVLGSRGHSGVERVFLGSVSFKVANEAHCSVHIGRGTPSKVKERPTQILVGFDGTSGSLAAVRAVSERNWPEGTQALLLTCVGFGFTPVSQFRAIEDHDRIEAILGPSIALLRQAGLPTEPLIVEDDPKISLVEVASDRRANVVFMGHNDHRLAYRILLGTTASAVVPRAPCSVEVIRARQ